MKLTKEEDQVVCKFLKNIIDESGEQLFKLTQFMLLQWSEEAIRMNAAEIALKQTIDYEGDRYNTRMSIQYSKVGEKSLEEHAYEVVDRMLSAGSENCDPREYLKRRFLLDIIYIMRILTISEKSQLK